MAREAEAFYRRLAFLLAEKRKECYSVVMGWLRCKLSFALLRSAIMFYRDTRKMKEKTVRLTLWWKPQLLARCQHSFLVHVSTFIL